jgi:hypothetical protein
MVRLLVFCWVVTGCVSHGPESFPAPWQALGTWQTAQGDTLRLGGALPNQPDSAYAVLITEYIENDTLYVYTLAGPPGPVKASVLLNERREAVIIFLTFLGPQALRRAREAAESILGRAEPSQAAVGNLVWEDVRRGLKYEIREQSQPFGAQAMLATWRPGDPPRFPDAVWRACLEGATGLCPRPMQ